ncbi:MAG: fructose-bisphosphatase class II, partial [Spirochaetia bacterium]|nr:fructose-bisphosphatase class II [Spirochaetia bacterium]
MSIKFDELAPHLAGITESVARAVMPLSAKGLKDEADHIAVETMRAGLEKLPVRMHVVLGEGEKDNAPMLYTGERFGTGKGPVLDLVVDPLECTTNFSKGLPDSMSVLLALPEGKVQELPGTYMHQILVQGGAASVIDASSLDAPPQQLIRKVADKLKCEPGEITVVVQDRPRHKELIEGLRESGAGISLISSGSISAGVEVA